MADITIPALPNKATPVITDLLEISANPGSFHITLGSLSAIYQPINEKGVANGYASLDGSILVPVAQIPALNVLTAPTGAVNINSQNLNNILNADIEGYIDIAEIVSPANPAANIGRLYVKDVAAITTLFFRDFAGNDTNISTPAVTINDLTDVTITTRAANQVLVVNGGNTLWINALLVNANIDGAAAIDYSKLNLTGLIVNADLTSGVFGAITGLGAQSQALDMSTNFIDIAEIGTPANPAANVGRLYVKDNGAITQLFFRDSAGLELNLSVPVTTLEDLTDTTITTVAANESLVRNVGNTAWVNALLVNANVDASAAIDYSKLNLTGLIVNADIAAAALIVESKLSVATGIAGTVLTSNGVGSAPTYQAAPVASLTPWVANIDADGFDLTDLSNIEFRNTTGAPAGSITAIYRSGAVLNLNADAGDAVTIRAGGTAFANFGNGAIPSLQMTAASIQQALGTAAASTGFMSLIRDGNYYHITGTTTITNITATGWQSGSIIHLNFDGALTVTDAATGSGEIITADSANYVTVAGDVLTLVLDGTQWIEVSRSTISSGGGEVFTWTANHSAAGFDLTNIGVLDFASPADAGTQISADATGIKLDAFGAADTVQIRIGAGSTVEYEFKNNGIEMAGNLLLNVGNFLDANNNELLVWVTTASAINYIEIENSITGANPIIRSNTETSVGITFQAGTDGGFLFTNQFGQEILDLVQETGNPTNYLQIRSAITATGPIITVEGSDTNVDLNINTKGTGLVNLNSVTAMIASNFQEVKGANVASASALLVLTDGNVFDVTGTTTVNTIPATSFQAGSIINLQFDGILTVTNNSGGTNDILLGDGGNMTTAVGDVLTLFFNGVDWQEVSRSTVSAGGGEFNGPYTADTDFARFDLDNMGVIYFHTSGPIVNPAAVTSPYIWFDNVPTALEINTPSGNGIILAIAGVPAVSVFAASVLLNHNLDMADKLVLGVNQIREFGTVATAGWLRLANASQLAWDLVGTGNGAIEFNASDQFDISFNVTTGYTFSTTVFDVISKAIEAVTQIQDTAQNEQLVFAQVASAVNEFTITNAATGNGPILSATGGNTDIDINITPKGIGLINLNGDVLAAGNLVMTHRFQGAKGADVASATTITLVDGNLFDVTGTTQIDAMTSTGWQAGSVVILHFDGVLDVTHNTGADGFFLLGAATFATTADDTLTVVWNGSRWEEISRSVN